MDNKICGWGPSEDHQRTPGHDQKCLLFVAFHCEPPICIALHLQITDRWWKSIIPTKRLLRSRCARMWSIHSKDSSYADLFVFRLSQLVFAWPPSSISQGTNLKSMGIHQWNISPAAQCPKCHQINVLFTLPKSGHIDMRQSSSPVIHSQLLSQGRNENEQQKCIMQPW